MFFAFFLSMRKEGIPVTVPEFLYFLEGMTHGLANFDLTALYHLARAVMVKDERHLDRFDRAFAHSFQGAAHITTEGVLQALDLPANWLQRLTELTLTDAEKAQIAAAGGFDALMDKLRQRLAEQRERHQGGNKWIGTAGTSPFGAYGFNPEGVRIGQDQSRHQQAVKIWDKRIFRNLDDQVALGTRNIKIALRGLRRWARQGAADKLDLEGTVHATAHDGWLNVQTRPERRNAVKVVLFLDVGGSMDPYVKVMEELFSAARAEFKHLVSFYFHNCLYEAVWRDNARRWDAQTPTAEVLRTYGKDYKCIFVGDASMSPYEVLHAGGANEYWNTEAGQVWLERACHHWERHLWINPVPPDHWGYTPTIGMISKIFSDQMVPMTVDGIARGIRGLR